jgi:hypothetical protein
MKAGCSLMVGLLIFVRLAFSQTPVTLLVDTASCGIVIPPDYLGFSFGTGTVVKSAEGYVFDTTNTQLLHLFRELGIRNLRIGGTAVDKMSPPPHADVDALFRFAKSANVKVIYSLRLSNGDPLEDASAAKYIWDNHREYLDCFSIGNEPNYIEGRKDPEVTDYNSYRIKWKRFARAVLDSVPEAKFGGPDATTTKRGITWGPKFARDEAHSSYVRSIFFHYYVGSDANGKTAQELIDAMLSKEWVTTEYPERYDTTAGVALRNRFPYRLTEANSYCGIPVPGGSNAFSTSLFSLDFLYWWASHGCPGINFHCTMPKLNTTIYRDAEGNYQIHPVGYGIKAFDLGGHGRILPVKVSNPHLNVTAYAVLNADTLFVTIINKEHGANANDVAITIEAFRHLGTSEAMYLMAPNNDVAATSGIMLGGDSLDNSGDWNGKWTSLDFKNPGQQKVVVRAGSAAIVKLQVSK